MLFACRTTPLNAIRGHEGMRSDVAVHAPQMGEGPIRDFEPAHREGTERVSEQEQAEVTEESQNGIPIFVG